ncbi:hypothetical protein GUITHDRAFT_166928 [Guillardia theta CCMP2712]|uniref:Uncharacterized protein n=1 Tax=Guillardia theta (strain CCMP2712) TaxID=905079 RepID=L1I4P8_GUITC|nr:hypothetical protein GUITHDRAFT_166928 [Guillardia theta CCMP2712]EKX31221.1 hypothetical protein GUITHDRAFT_166928 [Guillardia theta CCMP2712]|eukprot:XP_005818201.1 hypothetical protein GUITHDRAFT_166928 [Guillardia theta CCMP2712]
MSAGGAQKLLEDEKLAIEECMKGAESVVEPPDLSSAGKGSEAGVLQRSASAEGAEEEAQPAEEETPEKEHEADLPPRQSLDVEAPARMSIDESSTAGSAITNTPSAASQGGERVDGEKAGQSSSVWSRLKAARTMLKTGTPSKGEEAAAHAAGSFSDKAGEHKGAQGEKGKAWRSSGISAMSAMAAAATGAGKAAAGAAQSLATHAHIASHSSDERHSSHAAMAAHEANHLQAPSKIKEKLVRGGFMSETGVASARSSSSVSLPSSIWILELLLNGTHISLWDEAQNRVRSLVTLPKFGEELTRLPATLRGTIWSVCRDYYQMFHRSSILMVQVFTGATLKVARLIGEYLHLMRLLPPVAHDAVLGLRELLSYYLLLTADLFTPPDMSTKSVQVGGGMEILRRRGAESMQLLLRHMEAARPVAPLPLLTCQAVLKSPDAFFGLGERCVAIESLLFLVEVMQAVRVSLSQLSVPKSASDVKSIFKEIVEHIPGMEEFGLKPLPFFTHVELFIKGYFLPPDSPQVMVEWAYQHPFYPPHQVLGLVQAVIESNSHHTSSFSALMGQGKSKSTEVKRVLAQVEEAVRTNVSPSASMSLHALAMAR